MDSIVHTKQDSESAPESSRMGTIWGNRHGYPPTPEERDKKWNEPRYTPCTEEELKVLEACRRPDGSVIWNELYPPHKDP